MTDFTKEELIKILDVILTHMNEYPVWRNPRPEWNPIVDKIQCMIDNYCDHATYNDFMGGAGSKECVDCGKVW